MYHVVFCTVLQNAMARYEVNHKFVILWQFSKKSLIAGRSNYGQRQAQGRPGPHGRRLKQPPPPPLVYQKVLCPWGWQPYMLSDEVYPQYFE